MGYVLKISTDNTTDNYYDFGSCVQKIVYSKEKVWSENTRRNASALMQGKIVALKYTLDVSIKPGISKSVLDALISRIDNFNEWHKVEFTPENGGEPITKTMYFGNPSYEPYWFVDGKMLLQTLNFKAIER